MKLRELHLLAMPGFERGGFSLAELDAGLNVVVGPNGSGKTTTCRAIRGLVWPDLLDRLQPVAIESIWDDAGQTLRIERRARQTVYQRDGMPADAPIVPGSHLAECFTVTVDELFDGSRTDADLAERVARQMAGGYNLGAVRQSELLRVSSRYGRSEADILKQARQTVERITAEQQRLRGEEDELADLERQAGASRSAEARLKALDAVRERYGLKAQLDEIEARLRELPPNMDKLRGDEPARLALLRADLKKAEAARHDAAAARQRAVEQLAGAALPDDGVAQPQLDELDVRLDRLAGLERDLTDRRRALSAAEVRCEQALRILSPAGTPEALENLDLAGLDRLDAFHRDAEKLAAERRAAESQLALLGESSEMADVESLGAGLQLLRQWFEVGPTPESPDDPQRRILLWSLIAALAVLGVLLAVGVSAWWLALVPLAGGAAWLAWRPATPPPSDLRAPVRDRFGRLSIAPPAIWEQDAVGRRVNELERALAEARAAESREERRRGLHAELERTRQREAAVEATRQSLIARFGVAPEASDLALTALAGQLAIYQQSRVTAREAVTELDRLRADAASELTAINQVLGQFGYEPTGDLAEARPRKVELARRADSHRQALATRAAAELQLADAEQRITVLRERESQLFLAAGLDSPDPAELDARVERRPEYRKFVEERTKLSARYEALEKQLAEMPDLANLTLEDVDQLDAKLRRQADGYRALIERMGGIRSRMEAAARSHDLEAALAARDRATDALHDCRERTELAAAGRLLLDQVEQEYRIESQPPVIRRASEWFVAFTHGRYELRVADGPRDGSASFLAFDTQSQRGLSLDELSRGTRMQLLLAVRLAFAIESERGACLPVLLDEVLSSSDPERFAAIAECVLALVAEGRQVFYFTCQPGDAAAWRELAQRRGMAFRPAIDLATVRGLPNPEPRLLTLSAIAAESVPAPKGRTLVEYIAALDVPPLDPSAGAAPAHLAHLVDSAGALHRLLQASVPTYGRLQAMAAHGRLDAVVDSAALARIDARARAIDAFAAAWRVGRGQPLTREALAESGVTDKFLDGVSSLAEELHWNAARLLEALDARNDDRVKGFRAKALDQMRERLTATGHLDPRPAIEEHEVRARVLAAAGNDIQQGILPLSEVSNLVDRLWNWASD